MITGTVVVDLNRDSETTDRRVCGGLYGLPEGIRVVLNVGSREYAPPWTLEQLRQYTDRVHFDVHGSNAAVRAWVSALRVGEAGRWGWSA